MREGMNPQKQEQKIALKFNHRIIIVVYIPNQNGYYKNLFEVFQLCLESIIITKNDYCAITIVNNGSCVDITDYINNSYRQNRIDTVIHHIDNIGKIDALIGAARGSREPLITLTDVDILFKTGWQENIELIFSKIENVGSVSPIAVRKSMNYGTSSTLKRILLKKVNFALIKIPENFIDYNKYLESINWNLDKTNDKLWPVINKNGVKAILGSGHQVLTINRDILFTTVPKEPSRTLVGNNSEFLYIDNPIDRADGMRLATFHNFAYHMGNKTEDWMKNVQIQNSQNSNKNNLVNNDFSIAPFKFKKVANAYFKLSQRIYIKWFNLIYKPHQL